MPRPHLPLRAIVAFEAVARLESVTRAAEELAVTQSAVSRQIAALETHVRAPLFVRAHRRLRLTVQGRELYEQVSESLRGIEAALRNVPTSPDCRRLTIATHATFALKWLIPRFGRFKSACSNIELHLKISPEEVDFSRELVDGAVQYTPFVGRDLYSRRLCSSAILPACHPDQFADFERAVADRTLAGIPLIHTQTRPNDWLRWLQHFGVEGSRNGNSLVFENSFLAYEAARKGLGVAIAHRSMVLDDIENGLLTAAHKFALPIEETFHFVTVEGRQHIQSLRIFEEWLVSEFSSCNTAEIQLSGEKRGNKPKGSRSRRAGA